MSELSKYLVEQILLEEPTAIKKTVVVYVGRFQPFHKGHYGTYSHLVKKFGNDNVYIGTSNKVEKPKSPFNFKEKKQIMTTMFGVPSNKIFEVKNPYAPLEILKKFDEKTTAFITVVGEKDASRLGGKYFQKWDGKPTEGYKDRGYVYASPMQSNSVSGTEVRIGLGSGSEEQKKNFFLDRAYPKFNKTIFSLITNKLQESCIRLSKSQLEDLLIEASSGVGQLMVDDGPNIYLPSFKAFNYVNAERAKVLGWEVLQKFLEDDFSGDWIRYPEGPVTAVSFFPAGVIGKTTSTNQIDIYVKGAYTAWYKHATRKATLMGWTVVDRALDIDNKVATQGSIGDVNSLGKEMNTHTIQTNLKEVITLPVEIGDTLLMGKFKNKKVVVKSIGKDEHGMPTINGKKVVTFRLVKEGKQIIFEDEKDDEKYTHIGYGKYKEKGKEKQSGSATFKKDDNGKYVPIETGDSNKSQPKQGTSLDSKTTSGKQYQQQLPDGDPAKKEQPKQEPKEKVKTFKGEKSGKEIQTLSFGENSGIFGVEHDEIKQVDDIISHVKKTIPKEKWKDIVFVGEGGMPNDDGEIEFNGEQDYAREQFEKLGASSDTWDGEETNVFDNESPLYKYQEEETGLSNEEVMAANWASMIGQGDSIEDMTPEDYLTDKGKELLKNSAKEANLPLSDQWDSNPTDEDIDTLYRLSFAEDNNDVKTKVNDAQEAFNKFRDVNLLRKTKELKSQGKIPIVLAGESHVELVGNMLKQESVSTKPVMMESTLGTIECEICEHSWEIEVEDEHPYLCHNCGWDSQQQEYDFDEFDEWKEENNIDEVLTQAQRASRRWSFEKNRKLINIKKDRTKIRKKAYSILYKRAYKLSYLYVRNEWTQRLFGSKKYDELSLPQKQRVSQMVQKKKRKIIRLAKFRFFPALKQKEADRFKTTNQYPGNLTFTKPTNEMSMSQLKSVEKYAEKQLSPEDIEFTKHFFDRVNDPRNGKEISDAELTGFFKRLSKHKKQFKDFLEKYKQIVVKDKRYDINIPFVKTANQIIAKTVMRKDDFKTSSPTFAFEQLAKGMDLKDIANKHQVDIDDLNKELQRGIKVEMEHTPHRKVAEKIAIDHLFEDPKYYTKLATIEELAPHGYPDQEWMDNHEKKMKKLRKQLDSMNEVAARYIEPKRVEAFLKKYPKAGDLMQKIVDKVKDVDRGYQIFLHYKDDKRQEQYFGGKKDTKSKSTNVKGLGRTALNKTGKSLNSKTSYKYEWDGKVDYPTWGEVFQYIWNKKYEEKK